MKYFSYTWTDHSGDIDQVWTRYFGRYDETEEKGYAEVYRVRHESESRLSYDLIQIYLTPLIIESIENGLRGWDLITEEEFTKVMEQLTAYDEERNMADERLRDLLK